MKLVLENKNQANLTPTVNTKHGGTIMMTPPIDESYWQYRVVLSKKQAIIGFPKYTTVGIGFQVEEDWNTNLPFSCSAEKIYNHIKHNKGDGKILKSKCITAINMIKDAVRLERGIV
jgi:hypothetical protein